MSTVMPMQVTDTDPGKTSKMQRLVYVAVPSAMMTVGLFAAMQQLVKVDDFSPPDQTRYIIEAYMGQPEPRAELKPTVKPPRPKPIDPPPLPDALVNSVDNPDLPTGGYEGIAPADYGAADLESIKPGRTTAITVRTLQPLTPPVPIYPRIAESRNLEGACDVHFSVSIRGEPFDINAKCSDRVFVKAAEKSVKKVKFAPQIRDGLPVTVTGVVYPLEFRLKQ